MDFRIDHNSPVPFHAQIEGYLRELIKQKEYKNGEAFLPKEVTMSKRLGVSRSTTRQAINKLVHEGLIERKKGIGTKVVSKKITTRLDNWISFTKEMRNQGIEVVNYMVRKSFVKAPKPVVRALDLAADENIWKLEKIRGSKTARYLYSVSYFHPRVGIKGDEDFFEPLYEVLERQHNIVVATSKERLRAVKADKDIGSFLEVGADTPILRRERLVMDVGDKPVEYNVVYYHTDFFTYDIDIKRNL
ncbi:GntR family transcriptional regulator [Maribacter sp. 2307ULW6-5]|uniref:GntR family transcriptional regulator n=1 Tax=Maribacter sp. 2307ULW6-5 TaxID=3386275 RepID=UPI0039BD3185